jgi:hypothetical protein
MVGLMANYQNGQPITDWLAAGHDQRSSVNLNREPAGWPSVWRLATYRNSVAIHPRISCAGALHTDNSQKRRCRTVRPAVSRPQRRS